MHTTLNALLRRQLLGFGKPPLYRHTHTYTYTLGRVYFPLQRLSLIHFFCVVFCPSSSTGGKEICRKQLVVVASFLLPLHCSYIHISFVWECGQNIVACNMLFVLWQQHTVYFTLKMKNTLLRVCVWSISVSSALICVIKMHFILQMLSLGRDNSHKSNSERISLACHKHVQHHTSCAR